MNLDKINRAVVIQTAFLGDIALSFYFIQALKNIYPSIEITFVTTPSGANLASCIDAVDKVLIFDKRGIHSNLSGMKAIAGEIRTQQPDVLFSLHRSLRTTLVAFMSGAKLKVGYNTSALSFLYNNTAVYSYSKHEIERNLSLIGLLEQREIVKPEHVFISFKQGDKFFIDRILKDFNGKRIVAIAPGSVWETKRWEAIRFAGLAEKLIETGFQPVLIGSGDDAEICSFIAERSGARNLAGETSLPQMLYLLSRCSLTVTNDSAPTHFAGLVACPSVVIFGPTSPIFGFAPFGSQDIVVETKGMKCRPCRIHGSRRCPLSTHDCMRTISVEQVFESCLSILSRS
jgi:heptosyltransferase-2